MRRYLAIVVVGLLLVVGSQTAFARTSASSFLQGLYSDLKQDGAKGLILVDDIRAHHARLTVALGGLEPGHSYRIVIGSARCFEPNDPATRVARIDLGPADDAGAIFSSSLIGADGSVWRGVWSLRLMEEEGIFYYCQTPNRLNKPMATSTHADGAFARFAKLAGAAVTVTPTGGSPTVRLALNGLQPLKRYQIVHSPLTCAQFLEGDPDQPIVVGSFKSNSDGMSFVSRTETVNNNENVTVGSYRIERASTGKVWACANQHPYTLFLPPG